ncbi:MAG TPA: dienelactone hydrolase family protein [Rubricoccaceae bacterium]|jgi:predicted esterase
MSSALAAGTPLAEATTALVLVHGRGATAQSIVGLGVEVARGLDGVALLAPQAPGGTWYPNSFLAPLAANEPHLTRAIASVVGAVERARDAGVRRVVLGGFSQGACLAFEVAARHGAPLGLAAAFGLSGALIGTADAPDGDKRFDYPDRLDGVPVFAGLADVDAHVPPARFQVTAAVFERLGAAADFRVYPGLGHAVNAAEVEAVRALVAGA